MVARSIPRDNASKERMPLPEKRSNDVEHKDKSMVLKRLSLMKAFDGLRRGLSRMLINLDLYLPEIILNLLFNSFTNSKH